MMNEYPGAGPALIEVKRGAVNEIIIVYSSPLDSKVIDLEINCYQGTILR